MSDLTLCRGGECSMNFNCHRYTTLPKNPWQSYFAVEPDEQGYCQYYLPLIEDKIKKTA